MPVIYNDETIEKRTAKLRKKVASEMAVKDRQAKQALAEQARRQKAGQCWD